MSTNGGPLVFGSIGLFMLPLGEEFGWNRVQISEVLIPFTIASMLALPIAGRLVDRFGARKILLPALLVVGCCLAAIPVMVSELWHLAAIFFVVGSIGIGTSTITYMPVLSAWFDKHRGLAIGIAASGTGLGYIYIPMLVQFMSGNFGWRGGYYALSAVVLLVSLPIAWLMIRESPAEMGLMPDGATTGQPPKATSNQIGLTVPEVLKTREFWLLAIIFIVLSFVLHGMLAHLVPMLRDRGMEPATAAYAASMLGTAVFAGRLLTGFLVDRIFAPYVALVFFTLSGLGMAIYAFGASGPLAFLSAVLIGLSLGAEIDLMAYLASRYFGLRSFGTVCGLLFAAILCGTAFGPRMLALGYENSGSYVGILKICVGINFLALIPTALLRAYPNWEEVDGET